MYTKTTKKEQKAALTAVCKEMEMLITVFCLKSTMLSEFWLLSRLLRVVCLAAALEPLAVALLLQAQWS